MERDIYRTLCNWKDDKLRQPLLLRGARQIGKTFIINEFGRKKFKLFVSLNFERNPEFKEIFVSNNPADIIEKISLFTGAKIIAGKTLLFLDEIQECPQAIMSLRYFFEEMPDLHVIAAGSLLEFALESEDFRIPVGRIQYLYMAPMSFSEFLNALGEENLRNYIHNPNNLGKLPESLHRKLNEYIRKYFLIGGMPAVVHAYIKNREILKCQKVQLSIIDTYIDDFAKYAKKIKHRYLEKIYNAVPVMVGQKFIYANVDSSIKSRDLKEAVELLEMAGVINRVSRTSGEGMPLKAGVKDNFFKLLFLDVGLLHAINGIYAETSKEKDFTAIFGGAVAEQFAGQELIAYKSPYTKPKVYYWAREAKSSNAELDYLVDINSEIFPLEIKSGSKGRMKSLKMFLETYKIPKGIKISQAPYSSDKQILSLPFYAIESLFYEKEAY